MAAKRKKPLDLDQILSDADARKSRALDDFPELLADLRRFLALKRGGDPRASMSTRWLYIHKLKPHYSGPTWPSVRSYLHEVEGLDSDTGERLTSGPG